MFGPFSRAVSSLLSGEIISAPQWPRLAAPSSCVPFHPECQWVTCFLSTPLYTVGLQPAVCRSGTSQRDSETVLINRRHIFDISTVIQLDVSVVMSQYNI